MEEIVLVTLAIDTATAEIDPKAPFMVNSFGVGPDTILPMKTSRASSSNSVPASVRLGSKPAGMMRKGIGYSASEWTTLDGGSLRGTRLFRVQVPPLRPRGRLIPGAGRPASSGSFASPSAAESYSAPRVPRGWTHRHLRSHKPSSAD
jgi:hypothetical protein